MFLAFLALLFGGGIWGFGTEQGRDFFGGLLVTAGNFLSGMFPGLNGIMGFLNPSQDPDGTEREQFVRNGNMPLIQQGMQRFADVPADVVQAIAPDRAGFDEFLTALGPQAVAAVSRSQDAATIVRNITPETIGRVLGNQNLAGRVLTLADRRLAAGGDAPAANTPAAQIISRIRETATSLLLDERHAATLQNTLSTNPQLLTQARPLLLRQAGPQGAPFVNALTANPATLTAALEAVRAAGLNGESLLTEAGQQAAITPRSLSEILSRPSLSGPLLTAATQAIASGPADGPANPLVDRVQAAAMELVTNPAQRSSLDRILQSNPGVLAELRPLLTRAAGPQGAPFVAALTANPATLTAGLDAMHAAGVNGQSLLTAEGQQAAITPRTLTEILSRPALSGPLLTAAAQSLALPGGEANNPLGTRVQAAATDLLTRPDQHENLRRILSSNPDVLGQVIPVATTAMARGGAGGGTIDIGAVLNNPALREHLARPGQVAALSASLTEAVRTNGTTFGLSAENSAFLTANNGQNLQLLVRFAADSNNTAFLTEALPIFTGRGQAPEEQTRQLISLVTNHPAQAIQLLEGVNASALPAGSPQRAVLETVQKFVMDRTAGGRSNFDEINEAITALRTPDGSLPAPVLRAVHSLVTNPPTAGQPIAADTMRSALVLLAADGGGRAVASLQRLNLDALPNAGAARDALAMLTPENTNLLRRAAPHLLRLDNDALAALVPVVRSFLASEDTPPNRPEQLGRLLDLARNPQYATAIEGILRDTPPEAVPTAQREAYTTARNLLTAPARTADGAERTNLAVMAEILRSPVMQGEQGRALITALQPPPSTLPPQAELDRMPALHRRHLLQQTQAQAQTHQRTAMTNAIINLAAHPDAAPVLQQIGQLNLEALGPQTAGLTTLLNGHNAPLVHRALTNLDPTLRQSLASLIAGGLGGESLGLIDRLTDSRVRSLVQNPEVRQLIVSLQTEGLPSGGVTETLSGLRDLYCAPGGFSPSGIAAAARRRAVRVPSPDASCTVPATPPVASPAPAPNPAPQRTSDSGTGTRQQFAGLSASITGGESVEADSRIRAGATPAVTDQAQARQQPSSPTVT